MRKLVGEEGVVQVRGTPTFVGKRSYHSFATHVPKKVYRIMPSSLCHGSWLVGPNRREPMVGGVPLQLIRKSHTALKLLYKPECYMRFG